MRETGRYSANVAEKKLKRYAQECALFSWEQIRSELGCDKKGWMNIAHAALERHETGAWGNRIALRSINPAGHRRDITYSEFTLLADKFATALRKLGVAHGDRVFIMGQASIEMHVAIMGALQNGAVVAPLLTNLGLGPVATRIGQGKGKVLVTTPDLYDSKIASLRRMLPDLEQVIIIGAAPGDMLTNTLDFDELMEVAPADCVLPNTRPGDPAFLHYSTDKTGRLIGMEESHSAMLAHFVAGKYVLGLQRHDVFWSEVEFGCSTGLSCGVVAPFLHGATCLIDEAEFEPSRCYRILQDEKVNVWLTNPSVLRTLKSEGSELHRHYQLEDLRHISSAGGTQEELSGVARKLFGQPIHNTGWATETGRVMIAGLPDLPLKSGSLGLPLPGVEASIVKRSAALGVEVLREPDQEGELAFRCSSPDLFNDLLRNMHGTKGAHVGDYYLTGITGFRDHEGYFFLQKPVAGVKRPLETSHTIAVLEPVSYRQDNSLHV